MDKRKKAKKKMRKWLKWTLGIAFLILACVIAYVVYVALQFHQAASDSYHNVDRPGGKSQLREEKLSDDEPFSILLTGIESYATKGKNGRADTEIVVTLNPKTQKLTMV